MREGFVHTRHRKHAKGAALTHECGSPELGEGRGSVRQQLSNTDIKGFISQNLLYCARRWGFSLTLVTPWAVAHQAPLGDGA